MTYRLLTVVTALASAIAVTTPGVALPSHPERPTGSATATATAREAQAAGPLGTLVIPATRPAAASRPGVAPGVTTPVIPADCTTNAIHLNGVNTLSLVSSSQARTTNGSLIDALVVRKLDAKLTFTPLAVAPVSLRFPTASTVELIALATHARGDLYRLVITSSFGTGTQRWTSSVNTTRISVGGFATVRSMTYKNSLLYALRTDNTFTRYHTRPGLVGLMNTTRLAHANWNTSYQAISLATTAVTGTGTARVHWDQLRGLSRGGALMEARVARTSAAATRSLVLGPRGWDSYTYLYLGGCTKNPTTVMMMAALRDGRLELWKHTGADRLQGSRLERTLIFAPQQLESGRLFG